MHLLERVSVSPIRPPPTEAMGRQSIPLIFPARSQTIPGLCEVRALQRGIGHGCQPSNQ